MDARRQRFGLGLFVVGASVLLAGLVVFFGGTPRYFVARNHYTIQFIDAPGVTVGTPVRRSGVRIGDVTAVDLDDVTGEVHVRIAVDRKYNLRTTDDAVISQDLLSRDTTIDFIPRRPNAPSTSIPNPSAPIQPAPRLAPPVPIGPAVPAQPKDDQKGVVQARWMAPEGNLLAAGQPPLGKEPPKIENLNPQPPAPPSPAAPGEVVPPGSTIRGRSPADPRALIGQATDIIPSVQQSLDQIRRLVELLTPRLDDATREIAVLAKSLRELVPEVRRTNDDLRLTILALRTFAPSLKRTIDELQATIANFGRAAERIDVLVQTNQAAFEQGLKQINELTQRANTLLSDENQRNVSTALRNFQTASGRFESVAANTDEFIKEGRKTAERLQVSLNQFDALVANLNNATRPLAERSDRVLRNLDLSLEQIARAVSSFNELFGGLARGDGTVQKLFSDPAFYNNLNDSALMLTRIVPRLDRILRDVEVFADKIARHPETLGIGGAVRPNSGLKEGPTGIAQPAHRQRP